MTKPEGGRREEEEEVATAVADKETDQAFFSPHITI